VFSETLKDHNTAVANWRRIEQELKAKQAGTPVRTTTPTGAPVPEPGSEAAKKATR
jgi:hypothetical protein